MAIAIDADKCGGCGACVDECPSDALSMGATGVAVVDEDECLDCMICQGSCPHDAISEGD